MLCLWMPSARRLARWAGRLPPSAPTILPRWQSAPLSNAMPSTRRWWTKSTWAVPTRRVRTTATSPAWRSCWRVCRWKCPPSPSTGCAPRGWLPSTPPPAPSAPGRGTSSLPGAWRACHAPPIRCPRRRKPSPLATSPLTIPRWAGAIPTRAWRNCTAPRRWAKPPRTSPK